MDLSFQEKSLWLMFVGLIGAFGFYFAKVLPMGDGGRVCRSRSRLFVARRGDPRDDADRRSRADRAARSPHPKRTNATG